VDCLVTEIPESIRVNVADMILGAMLHVRDLELPSNVTAVTPGDAIVCSVRAKIAAEVVEGAVPQEGAAAEPEIIGRKEKAAEETEAGE